MKHSKGAIEGFAYTRDGLLPGARNSWDNADFRFRKSMYFKIPTMALFQWALSTLSYLKVYAVR